MTFCMKLCNFYDFATLNLIALIDCVDPVFNQIFPLQAEKSVDFPIIAFQDPLFDCSPLMYYKQMRRLKSNIIYTTTEI